MTGNFLTRLANRALPAADTGTAASRTGVSQESESLEMHEEPQHDAPPSSAFRWTEGDSAAPRMPPRQIDNGQDSPAVRPARERMWPPHEPIATAVVPRTQPVWPATTGQTRDSVGRGSSSGETIVRVTIGRIDVRAVADPTSPKTRPASKTLGLDEYLDGRRSEPR
jgi:hypothetical protein